MTIIGAIIAFVAFALAVIAVIHAMLAVMDFLFEHAIGAVLFMVLAFVSVGVMALLMHS